MGSSFGCLCLSRADKSSLGGRESVAPYRPGIEAVAAPMTTVTLALFCLAGIATLALAYFFFTGKYNTLITLRKHALQAWNDLTSADLRLANELRKQGFAAEADTLEEAAHYAVTVFGRPSAPEKLSAARERALARKPGYREHQALASDYEAKVNFYNATLRDPCCFLVAQCCGLRRLPQSTRIASVPRASLE